MQHEDQQARRAACFLGGTGMPRPSCISGLDEMNSASASCSPASTPARSARRSAASPPARAELTSPSSSAVAAGYLAGTVGSTGACPHPRYRPSGPTSPAGWLGKSGGPSFSSSCCRSRCSRSLRSRSAILPRLRPQEGRERGVCVCRAAPEADLDQHLFVGLALPVDQLDVRGAVDLVPPPSPTERPSELGPLRLQRLPARRQPHLRRRLRRRDSVALGRRRRLRLQLRRLHTCTTVDTHRSLCPLCPPRP